MAENEVSNPDRRDFLGITTAAVGAVGVGGAIVPFLSSMNPSSDVLAKATSEVDLSGIAVGEAQTVAWQGKPVFVVHRTPEQIASSKSSQGGKQPEADEQRATQPEWLIVMGVCTHLGCVPLRNAEGWLCPCHGSRYDNSGRIMEGPAPRNLEVPPYKIEGAKLIIGNATEAA